MVECTYNEAGVIGKHEDKAETFVSPMPSDSYSTNNCIPAAHSNRILLLLVALQQSQPPDR